MLGVGGTGNYAEAFLDVPADIGNVFWVFVFWDAQLTVSRIAARVRMCFIIRWF